MAHFDLYIEDDVLV